MADAKRQGRGERSFINGILAGACVSVGMIIIINMLFAWLISAEKLSQSSEGYCVLANLLLASASGALTAMTIVKKKKLIVAFVTGLLFFAVLLGVTVFFFGGEYDGVGQTAATIVGGSVGAALLTLGVGQKTQKGIKKRKYR